MFRDLDYEVTPIAHFLRSPVPFPRRLSHSGFTSASAQSNPSSQSAVGTAIRWEGAPLEGAPDCDSLAQPELDYDFDQRVEW